MKIILTNEVPGLGVAGEVVEVKDGYARNYLVPRGFAIRWTKGGQKDVDAIRRARKVRAIQSLEHANEVKGKLEGLQVKLAVRSGDSGRLFGSVTQADVVEAVKVAGGPSVDKRTVTIASPIKTVGSHRVTVKLHTDVEANLDVAVVSA
ncbi:50S ribosomal protein L9 [Streptomyces sp. NPDC092296]|uniref:50S ribosomal protein L9 n=1 Tax=Streptomyces sp. NPDC092296 TaxID=3366012 RepID=UPI0037F61234